MVECSQAFCYYISGDGVNGFFRNNKTVVTTKKLVTRKNNKIIGRKQTSGIEIEKWTD